jgi:hypothetical protein
MWTPWQRNRPKPCPAEVYGAGNSTRHEDRKHAVMEEKVRNVCHGRKTWRGRGIVCLKKFF